MIHVHVVAETELQNKLEDRQTATYGNQLQINVVNN